MRRFIVDTLAMILFCTATGMAVEMGVSGLSLEQSLQARLAAVPLNLLTARPYGLYRDALFRWLEVKEEDRLRTVVADVLAFVSFQVPIYALVLAFTGATLAQIVASCVTLGALSSLLGRPYGAFLDFCRRLGGVDVEAHALPTTTAVGGKP